MYTRAAPAPPAEASLQREVPEHVRLAWRRVGRPPRAERRLRAALRRGARRRAARDRQVVSALARHLRQVELALDHLGRKIGGLDVEIVYGDDQVKPDVGKQLADEMLKKHRVHFVAGVIWSNVMLAVAPTVTGAGTFMIGTNAGPHELAGKGCHELFFTTSWQNDQTPEAMGKYMQDQGLTDVYVMAPNYPAGKDMISGFKRYFKGRIVDEVYTKLGQTDYQAEISQIRAANPKAVFVFYPGGMGIQFLKQYAQAGLRRQIP